MKTHSAFYFPLEEKINISIEVNCVEAKNDITWAGED